MRLTLWYAGVLALALTLFAISIYVFIVRTLQTSIDEALNSYGQQVSRAAAPHIRGQHLDVKGVRVPPLARRAPVAGYLLMNVQGQSQASKAVKHGPAVPAYTQLRIALRSGKPTCGTILPPTAGAVGSTRPVPVRYCTTILEHKGKPVGGVAVEESLAGVDRTLDRLRLALILGIPFALLLAGGGGWILAGRALEPVDRITRMARSITATDLSQRINLNRQDELGRLAGTFDEMIARLERAFQEQRQLAADVSHELRSPLTILEAQASLALRRSRTSEEYQQVLISVQEEVERMSVMVNQLLLLARAEAGEEPVNLEPTSLSLIAQTVVDGMRPLADDKGVALTLRANPAVWVQGDAARLRQLLLNLIDNALNHTPMGGRIEVTVGRNRAGAFVAVEDTGEGIAPEDLPHIFQRFYRSDRARRRGTGNSGLGLAIVRWIVEAHGGQISVSSTPGEGASFVVSLRLASPAIRPLQPVT
jgi:heavy metal sensor kinase